MNNRPKATAGGTTTARGGVTNDFGKNDVDVMANLVIIMSQIAVILFVLSQCKITSAFVAPRSSGNHEA